VSPADPRAASPPRPADREIVGVDQEIYTFDIDFAGVVNNQVYGRWAEIWRMAWLERLGLDVAALTQGGAVPFLVRQEVNFRRALRLGESVRLEGWLERLGDSSVTLWLEVRETRSGELCCDARQVVAMADPRTGKSAPIPEALRRKVAALCPSASSR